MKNPFSYCPQCKNEEIAFLDEKKILCTACNFNFYQNVAGATAVLLFKNGKCLFTKRNKNPKKGFLDLPGGFIDSKESAEQGATRELKEELYVDIKPQDLKYLGSQPNTYLYKNICYSTIDLFFFYELKDQDVTTFEQTELMSVEFYDLKKLNINDLAFDSQKIFIKKYIKEFM